MYLLLYYLYTYYYIIYLYFIIYILYNICFLNFLGGVYGFTIRLTSMHRGYGGLKFPALYIFIRLVWAVGRL